MQVSKSAKWAKNRGQKAPAVFAIFFRATEVRKAPIWREIAKSGHTVLGNDAKREMSSAASQSNQLFIYVVVS